MPNSITEIFSLTPQQFFTQILPAGQPVVIRGLVKDWPIVQAGRTSAQAFTQYLKQFDHGYDVNTVAGPPSIKGRIFYNVDMSGLNCRMGQAKLSASLDYLLDHLEDDPAPTLAIQSVVVAQYLAGLEKENHLDLLGGIAQPRIWIGGKATVAAHFDPSENIACCLTGRRRFTLFPPAQVANLYVGPFESTPAGAVISMVDFNAPDYEKYPRFKLAQDAALVADLEPGDAIYIPYLWWHHVVAQEGLNALMNYWWGGTDEFTGTPRNALLHSLMAMKALAPHHKAAWQAMFDHYVFEKNGDPGAHLPPERRGILGELTVEKVKNLRTMLANSLSKFSF